MVALAPWPSTFRTSSSSGTKAWSSLNYSCPSFPAATPVNQCSTFFLYESASCRWFMQVLQPTLELPSLSRLTVAILWCKHPTFLFVHLSFCDHTGLSCFVAIFRNAIMSNYVSFCLCFWITVNLCPISFYLWTAIPFSTAAALTSVPTRVLLRSRLVNAGCLFDYYSTILKCVTWCPVSWLSFLVSQISMSFLVPCVYFLEKWLLQACWFGELCCLLQDFGMSSS